MSRPLAVALVLAAGALAAGASVAEAAPTTLYVSAGAASDPACAAASKANPFATLHGALACATKGSTVQVGAGTFPAQVTVPVNVTIAGAGRATVLRGSPDLSSVVPAITIPDGLTVTIKNLTIDGVGQTAQGIQAAGGHLTVTATTIKNTGSHTATAGGAIDVSAGTHAATLTVTNSTFNNNFSSKGGGAISIDGGAVGLGDPTSTLTIANSTFSGNAVEGGTSVGGAIRLATTNFAIRDSTITGNSAGDAGGGIGKTNTTGSVSITNTILAGNTAVSNGPDCALGPATLTDGGHNLVGVGCSTFADEANGDQVGTAAAPIDPVLIPLANNGGPTDTRKPQLGSPAIGAGDPADCGTAPISGTDQRGMPRNTVTRLVCDVGAYDTGGTALKTFYVSASAPSDPTCGGATQSHPFHTLAAALNCTVNGTAVKLGAGTFTGGVTIPDNVVVRGAGASTVIDGTTTPVAATPNVTVAPRAIVTLDGLTLDGGNNDGPGIASRSGRLIVMHSTITHALGGMRVLPVADTSAEVTLLDSTIANDFDNQPGAGILVNPALNDQNRTPLTTLSVLNSTITGNHTDATGGGGGGGISVVDAAVTVRDSTIAGNSSAGHGGGLLLLQTRGHATLTNTILAANTAAGSGVDCYGDTSVVTTSGGHNVVGQIDAGSSPGCAGLADNGVNGDQVGTSASPLDPMLAALASNGGPTQTMALLSGSPARGAGSAADAKAWPLAGKDQRGVSRNAVARGVSDVGAYDTAGTAG